MSTELGAVLEFLDAPYPADARPGRLALKILLLMRVPKTLT